MNKQALVILLVVVLGAATYWLLVPRSAESPVVEDDMKNIDMMDEGALVVATDEPNYFDDTYGYYAEPETSGEYPGVVMIHEWWGLNDNIKESARKLASEGYRVLAVDLYHGEVATESSQARELTGGLNQEEALENMNAAISYLREQGATSLASLGWCFGGGQSMQLALDRGTSGDGPPLGLDATVIYYGSLVTDEAELQKIQWPVLGIFGAEDTSIPVETVNKFGAGLDTVGTENEIHVYPGVGHAFANPSGANYAPDETMDAWAKTLAFLEESLK